MYSLQLHTSKTIITVHPITLLPERLKILQKKLKVTVWKFDLKVLLHYTRNFHFLRPLVQPKISDFQHSNRLAAPLGEGAIW